ncbi:MAG: protein phosphatase 2C domain-containing protein [Victivallis sp.]
MYYIEAFMRNRAGVIMAGESNLGLHRKRNEDNFCCYAPPGRKCALAVVADGVGGHANGAVASLICCRDLAEAFRRMAEPEENLPDAAAVFLRDKIRKINRKVFSRNYFEQVVRPMSSTIVAAVFMPEAVLLASAGDSRMYEFHPADGLVQLSTDHSFSAEFAREHGFLPPGSETMKNLIARAVGPRSELEAGAAFARTPPGEPRPALFGRRLGLHPEGGARRDHGGLRFRAAGGRPGHAQRSSGGRARQHHGDRRVS